ncbi:MAG: hypothetical protein ACXWF6_06440 [Usitatibacter sp.]
MVANAIGRSLIVESFDRAFRRLRPRWAFYAAIAAVVILPMLAVSALADLAGEPMGGSADVLHSLMTRSGAVLLLGIVIVPLIETSLLWAVIAATAALARNTDMAIVLASAILMLLHRPGGIGRAMAIAWPFLVWGAVLLSGRFQNRTHGFLAVWCLHAAHNAMVISYIYASADT